MIIPRVEQAIRPLEESAGLRAALRELELSTRHGQPPRELTLAGLTDTAKLLVAALVGRALARPLGLLPTPNPGECGGPRRGLGEPGEGRSRARARAGGRGPRAAGGARDLRAPGADARRRRPRGARRAGGRPRNRRRR